MQLHYDAETERFRAELREWLPKLVGIERHVELQVGAAGERVSCTVDPDHEKRLTRDEITSSVHYVGFALSPPQVTAFAEGPVALVVTHPSYGHRLELTDATRAELLSDLTGN